MMPNSDQSEENKATPPNNEVSYPKLIDLDTPVVQFQQIDNLILSNETIQVVFWILNATPIFKAEANDAIGIARVNQDDLIISQSIDDCAKLPGDNGFFFFQAEFDLNQIKNRIERDEKYQFCYRDHHTNTILPNRSNSFYIVALDYDDDDEKSKNIDQSSVINENSERSILDDENEFVVVKSKDSCLRERFDVLNETNKKLKSMNQSLLAKLEEKNTLVEVMSLELNDCKQQIKDYQIRTESPEVEHQARSVDDDGDSVGQENFLIAIEKVFKKFKIEFDRSSANTSFINVQKLEKENESIIKINEELKNKNIRLTEDLDNLKHLLADALSENRELRSENEQKSMDTEFLEIENKLLLENSELKQKLLERSEKFENLNQNNQKLMIEFEQFRSSTNLTIDELLKKFDDFKSQIESQQRIIDDSIISRSNISDCTGSNDVLDDHQRNLGKDIATKCNSNDIQNDDRIDNERLEIEGQTKILDSERNSCEKKPSAPSHSGNITPKVVDCDLDNQETKVPKIIQIPCEMCNETIVCLDNLNGNLTSLIDHYERIHSHRMCPICSVLFDCKLSSFRSHFSAHLNNHFSKDSKKK
ncbi:hypothetical protein NH340_JMT04341 [Sarcoptes scabiei]|nr:hypothetical protein NH340_JMT04341 [Sarcoptes scabiei]